MSDTQSSSTARRRSSISSRSKPARDAMVAAAKRARTKRSAPTGIDNSTISRSLMRPHSSRQCGSGVSCLRGFGEARVDGEQSGEAGDLEDLEHARVCDDDSHLASCLVDATEAADQDTESGRIDEGHVAQVDDHHPVLPDRVLKAGSQGGRGRQVDLACRSHDDTLVSQVLAHVSWHVFPSCWFSRRVDDRVLPTPVSWYGKPTRSSPHGTRATGRLPTSRTPLGDAQTS